ncbi:diacylglycerol acyltransferase-domain-containing protein [Mycena olivaceomarginata]|nr:diacylglycerol acyltransferase-domain-containing protein [Mycena olivaceomarginata]
MLAVALWSVGIILATVMFLLLCSYPPLWPFLGMYQIWALWIDKSPEHGGRTSPWFRSIKFWTYFADYYPASFLKEADLPADRPYLFGYHPHGIIGMGAVATFATEATGFSAAFPGIKPHLLTLASNFKIPFYRDVILAMGICSVSKKSCSNILQGGAGLGDYDRCGRRGGESERPAGHGGFDAEEATGIYQAGDPAWGGLGPGILFGENDIYEQMPNERGTTVYKLQEKFKAVFGFTLPLFHGRGLLNYNLGLMPYRRQIVAVIGRPIHVTQTENPSLEEVMRMQKLYIEELERIWNTYKDVFAKARTRELSIIA